MRNLWSDREARAAVKRYAAQGANADLALRTYTTRLLGGDPRLVQHGGGNTSVKTTVRDRTGARVDVLCVKGSGWDMATIEPPGLPAVRLAPLLKLAVLKALSDDDMVAIQRGNLIDADSPTPSVETLLHAFLPHKFIDHTHANAVLALCDRPDGIELCRKVFGKRIAVVPYVMPGFALALKAKEIFEANPDVEGLVLHKHGIFTFGDTAREAYGRMIDLVGRAGRALPKQRGKRSSKRSGKRIGKRMRAGALPKNIARPVDIAPIVRGLLALPLDRNEGRFTRLVLNHRASPDLLEYVNGKRSRAL